MPAFSGRGNRLGGTCPNGVSTANKRELVRVAAEKRLKRPVAGGGVALGGAVAGSPLPLKEVSLCID